MLSVEELEERLIDLAFAEDIGDGDHTTLCCIPEEAMGKSQLLVKEEGVLAGVEIARKVFDRFDPTLQMEVFIHDGAHVKPGDVAFIVTGKVRSLLQTERLMLNIMQRMSGIATMTHRYVERLEGTGAHVLDTRKTTPGLRILEKQAVKAGVSEDVAAAAFSGKNEYLDWLTASNNYTILRPELFNSSGAFSSPTLTINGEYWDLKQLTLADTNMVDGFLKSIGLDADQVGVEGKMPSIGASGKPISVAS